jgi:hypothetical protein
MSSLTKQLQSIDEIGATKAPAFKLYKKLRESYATSKHGLANPYEIFYGLPFYRFDLPGDKHLELYDKTGCRCCWNHFVGMPEKHGKRLPLFPYQKTLWEDFEKSYVGDSNQRMFAVLKATGLGITEYSIRIMAWMATSSSKYWGKRFAIIAGIRQHVSEEIIDRMLGLFDRFLFLNIKKTKARTLLNNVIVEGYPAENIDSLRSYHNLSFILVDEADFFRRSLQKSVRTVIERYIAKTNPFVYLVSTPNSSTGLFYELFREQRDNRFYKKYEFDYTYGLGYIFTQKEIDEQRESDNFEQEYNLQFGGTKGNLFSHRSIMKNVYTNDQAEKIGFNPYYFYKDIEDDSNGEGGYYFPRTIGVDPGFGRDPKRDVGSYTGITLTQWRNQRAEILYADELIQPDFDELVDIVSLMAVKTNAYKIFVDGSNPAFARALKNSLGEYPNYGKFDKKDLERKIYHGDMLVCPIAFNTKAREMMYNLKEFVDKGLLVIHEKQNTVVECLKSAVIINEKLDKELSAHDDLFDSMRLAFSGYRMAEKKIPAR